MELRSYLATNPEATGYAVVDSTTNRLLHTFKTDIVARAFSSTKPETKVIWLSKRLITETLK